MIVRLVVSQWVDEPRFALLLANVTCHATVSDWVSWKVVFDVVSDWGEGALVRVVEYVWPLTEGPVAVEPSTEQPPSCNWIVSVPLSGALWADVIVAVSLGTQSCTDEADEVSSTVKHSPEVASLEPRNALVFGAYCARKHQVPS